MVITSKRAEKKLPLEQLQEEHLSGPADESLDKVAEELQDNMVVIAKGVPNYEKVIFRNQRDPGQPLEFHYSSKSHPFKQYKLIDGSQYDLPREVIKNLETRRENIEKYRRNAEGIPEIFIAGYKSHFVCERV